uniref:Nrap protein domain-containing protein n=1 Tax=Glossina austeni TaxID=7395 RepID=A0A1A9UX07_GLOAU
MYGSIWSSAEQPNPFGCHLIIQIKPDNVTNTLAHEFGSAFEEYSKPNWRLSLAGTNFLKTAVEQLMKADSEYANPCGGKEIAVIWKLGIFENKEFKVTNMQACCLTTDGKRMQVNKDVLTEDIKFIVKDFYLRIGSVECHSLPFTRDGEFVSPKRGTTLGSHRSSILRREEVSEICAFPMLADRCRCCRSIAAAPLAVGVRVFGCDRGYCCVLVGCCDVVIVIVYEVEGLRWGGCSAPPAAGRVVLFSSQLPLLVEGDGLQLLIDQHGLPVRGGLAVSWQGCDTDALLGEAHVVPRGLECGEGRAWWVESRNKNHKKRKTQLNNNRNRQLNFT